jgi:murein DD-endopeptidase MepM/ murein hydrolase activator NlpD
MVDRRSRARKKTALDMGGKPPARRGTLRLFVLLAIMVLVNLYVFLWRDGTSIRDVRAKAGSVGQQPLAGKTPSVAPAPADPAQAGGGGAGEAEEGGGTIEGQVEKNESLGKILKTKVKLEARAADELIRAIGPAFDLRGLRPGQAWKVVIGDDGKVDSFELVVSKTLTVRVERDPDSGELAAKKDQAATRIEVREVGGRIDSSLYAAVKVAGADSALVAFFVDVFAYDLDFYNDTHEGDTFKVVVEAEYKDQEFLRYRRILAAEYAGKAGTFQVLYWVPPGKTTGRYYDEKGRSVEKSMLKTPLKFARVSSGFNPRRMHPVLHRVKGHFGTDFAAPTGTPVWAAADGVIIGRAPSGGAGNMVTLRHDNGLVTLYMHLSKFAAGQKVGQRVSAKTVIGYVGTTGLSTGPHLHFGVKKNGQYVDFAKLAPTRAAGVSRKDMPAFQADVAPTVTRLAAISTAPPAAAPAPPGGASPSVVAAPVP